MPQLPFIKMHGAENDYVFFDGLAGPLPRDPASLARRICDRHRGVGADGIICMRPPSDRSSDVCMQIWNADGSSAEMCGNAARCIAVWMQQQNRVTDVCRIQTQDRMVTAESIRSDTSSGRATVNMGPPQVLSSREGRAIQLDDASEWTLWQVHTGNPHAVIFVDELTDRLVHSAGPQLECHSDFPDRTNVEFVMVTDSAQLTVRVWERGSGETRACGSGACAAVAAATTTGQLPRGEWCQVHLPGGTLDVLWRANGDMLLAGPAVIAFTGTVETSTAPEE